MSLIRILILGLREYAFELRFNEYTINGDGNLLLGIVFIVLFAFAYGQAMDYHKLWKTAIEQVPAQFEPSPPPLFVAGHGCLGILMYRFYQVIMLGLVSLSADQIFAKGKYLLAIIDFLG